MTRQNLDEWVTKLGEAWVNLDTQAALILVDKMDIRWYESPFEDALTDWDDIHKVWLADLAQQKDVEFSHEVLLCDGTEGIARWQAKFVRVSNGEVANLEGIFHIRLNDKNLCTYFMMWVVERQ